MDLLNHPLLKSGGAVRIEITDPSTCFYCKSAPLGDEIVFCPSCGFPQRGTEKEQADFVWKKRALHRQLEEMQLKMDKAGNMLFITAGLFAVSYLIAFLQSNAWTLIEGGIVCGAFVGFGFWARKNPYPAVLTGLIFLGTILLLYALVNPITIISGIIWKIAIISALIYGLKAAREAKALREELQMQKVDLSGGK